MSAIHRVDDIHTLSAYRLFTWAVRLPAYPGVMQVRAQNEQASEPERPERYSSAPGVDEVPDTAAAAHRGFKGDGQQFPPVFEVKKGGGRE